MTILGVSGLYHDSAAAVVRNGEIIAAAQEERFTRKKADASLPANAINYCLNEVDGIVDEVVYYDNPLLTLDRWLSNAVEVSPNNEVIINKSYKQMIKQRLWVHDYLKQIIGDKWPKGKKLYVCEHHISHASSAFYPSPFEEAAVLTIDGVGEWATTTIGKGIGNRLDILEQIDYPNSIGLLYSAFTYFCGFKVNFGEYKLMGLAPYGEPKYTGLIKEKLVDIHSDGSYVLNQDFFTYMKSDKIISDRFSELFGIKKRESEAPITKPYMDIAASIQKITEEMVINLAQKAKDITKCKYLTMAGGTALNCVANGKILKSGLFDDIWIQPAAGDAGGALGCALYASYNMFGCYRRTEPKDSQKGTYLGPKFSNAEIKKFLDRKKAVYHYYSKDTVYEVIAKYLADDLVVGLHQGAMEYGPRALGNRSILANPLSCDMQSRLNLKIKYRESFRPFAPAVLEEDCDIYFSLDGKHSPYMLLTAPVKEEIRLPFESTKEDKDIYIIVNKIRSKIPAVTHVDYSARIQTVSKETNPYFYEVISKLKKLTGYGVVVNTSFNVRGEPIVCTPEDSWLCFMRTEMDVLVLENYVLLKDEQPKLNEDGEWRKIYELD